MFSQNKADSMYPTSEFQKSCCCFCCCFLWQRTEEWQRRWPKEEKWYGEILVYSKPSFVSVGFDPSHSSVMASRWLPKHAY